MAKKFFYVCAGLLLIALTYQLEAKTVEAQAGSYFRMLGPQAALVGETVYYLESSSWTWQVLPISAYESLPPVPPSSLISYQLGLATTDQGETWINRGDGWFSAGKIPGGATSSRPESWGQVKDRYRK